MMSAINSTNKTADWILFDDQTLQIYTLKKVDSSNLGKYDIRIDAIDEFGEQVSISCQLTVLDYNGTTGNGTIGNGTTGNGTTGNATGNGTAGNGTTGNGTTGNGTTGNGTNGNGTTGNGTGNGTVNYYYSSSSFTDNDKFMDGLKLFISIVGPIILCLIVIKFHYLI